MRRDFDEIIASQNKMLERRGEENQVADSTVKEAYIRHLVDIRYMVRRRPNFEMVEVQFKQAMKAPRRFVTDVNKFLGGNLDVESMMAVVDPELYRNRKQEIRATTSSS
jgi:hypothetical protein